MAEGNALVVTDAPLLDDSVLIRVSQSLGVAPEQLSVITSSSSIQPSAFTGRTFSKVVSLASTEGFHASGGLQRLSSFVSPAGRLLVQEPTGAQVRPACW